MGVFSFVFAKVIVVLVFALLAEVKPFRCVNVCCCSSCFWWPGVVAISSSFAVTPSKGDPTPSCTQQQKKKVIVYISAIQTLKTNLQT
jgi:hypothetical protein